MIEPSIYLRELAQTLSQLDTVEINAGARLLWECYLRDHTIFVVGNGGSASTASHFALDLAKNPVTQPGQRPVRMVSLTDNAAAVTAWANDIAYARIFSAQMESLWRPGDLLIAISTSGNSANVLCAAEYARSYDGRVLGLTGEQGQRLHSLCHVCIRVPHAVPGHIESVHLAICHYWVEQFKDQLEAR